MAQGPTQPCPCPDHVEEDVLVKVQMSPQDDCMQPGQDTELQNSFACDDRIVNGADFVDAPVWKDSTMMSSSTSKWEFDFFERIIRALGDTDD